MADNSEVLDAICWDALMALVLLASEDDVRRAAFVACVANGVPTDCADVIAAGLKRALDEMVAGGCEGGTGSGVSANGGS